MATVTFTPYKSQNVKIMKDVIGYCCQEKKVLDTESGCRLVSGVDCDGENAFDEFMTTKDCYHKPDGTMFYHYTQSFSPDENITRMQAHEIALEFARQAWPDHEVLVATHCDADHIHSHFIVNSVSYVDGRKLRQPPDTLIKLRKLSDEICQAHNLSVLEPYEGGGAKLSTREYRTAQKMQSWKFRLMSEINCAMKTSGSREEFETALNRHGYSLVWTDERKYITFTCPGGKSAVTKHYIMINILRRDYNMNSKSENNSQNNTQRNSSLEQLMQANEEAMTVLELIPYETVIYALPKEQRDAEMALLEQAVEFQPTLHDMISQPVTTDQLTAQRKLITGQLTDNQRALSTKLQSYRDQVTQETAERKRAMQDYNKALTERMDTLSRDGKKSEQNILDAIKEMQKFINSVKEMCSALKQKILLITAIAAATLLVLQPLVFVLWLKLLT